MGSTKIWEVVRQVRNRHSLKRSFSVLCICHNIVGLSVQRVWSRSATLCRGKALLCNEKVLQHCAWLEKVVWRSPDQPDLPLGVHLNLTHKYYRLRVNNVSVVTLMFFMEEVITSIVLGAVS